jgi:hypothetical protein
MHRISSTAATFQRPAGCGECSRLQPRSKLRVIRLQLMQLQFMVSRHVTSQHGMPEPHHNADVI